MPSPFPGMNPCLEDPALWPDVHHSIISVARETLGHRLRPKYFVRIEVRVYVSDEEDPGRRVLVPDLKIGETEGASQVLAPATTTDTEVAEPITITKLIDEEIHEAFLEVIDHESRRVITVLELISPSNKVSGSQGRASYLKKRREIMDSPVHWIEIDLHRTGSPLISRELLKSGDYFVHLSRAGERPESKAWPVRLDQRLPVIRIPLKPEDPDAELDLQQILETVYDRAGYDLTIDYRLSPVVPLSDEQAAWADRLLRSKGLR